MSFMDRFIDNVEWDRERESLLQRITLLEDRITVLVAECKRLSEELARTYG